MDFALAAGAPGLRYDRGYIADFPRAQDAGRRRQLALWHPPGYLLLLGAWGRLAPGAEASWLRLFGVVCGLGTLGAVAGLARRAAGPPAAALAALLWAAAPLSQQSALLLDIDGTVLPLATTLFVLLALRPGGRWPRAAIGVSFGIALWFKLTVPPAVALLLLAWLLATGRRRQAYDVGLACLAGAALAVGAWLALAAIAGWPPLRPVEDAVEALRQVLLPGPPSGTRLRAAPLGLVVLVGAIRAAQWLNPLAPGLVVAAPLALRRRDGGAALLLAGAGVSLLSLGKLAAGFPKYLAGPWPLLVAVVGIALAHWLDRPVPGRRWPAGWLAGGLVAGIALAVATGPAALIQGADLRLVAAWLGVGAALLALAAPLGGARPAALAGGLLFGAGLATAATLATQSTSTSYFFGAGGQVEAGRWLRDAAAADGTLDQEGVPFAVADREVAYYARPVHFVDTERWLDETAAVSGEAPPVIAPSSGTVRGGAVSFSQVRAIVSRHPLGGRPLAAGFRVQARFGEYVVWRRA